MFSDSLIEFANFIFTFVFCHLLKYSHRVHSVLQQRTLHPRVLRALLGQTQQVYITSSKFITILHYTIMSICNIFLQTCTL